jgi:hypothetical protein
MIRTIRFVSFIRLCFRVPIILFFLVLPLHLFSDGIKIMPNEGYKTVKTIFTNNCIACHSWPSSYKKTISPEWIVPFQPEESQVYLMVKDDTMPMSDKKLTPEEKDLVRIWIENGATDSNTPIIDSSSKSGSTNEQNPVPEGGTQETPLPLTIQLHPISGFTSTGLFFAAGIVSTVHFLSIMNQGHALEESGIANESNRGAIMMSLWNDPNQQTLRWWHVGLLATGEAFYLYNAVSGIGMWSKDRPGFTREKTHRWLFFLHGTLMVAQIALGFFETYALQYGSHDQHVGVGVAHAVIGFTIPTVMLIAGLENMR